MTKRKSVAFAVVGVLFATSLASYFNAHAQRLRAENALCILQAEMTRAGNRPSPATPAAESALAVTKTENVAPPPPAKTLPRSDASLLVANHPEIVRLFESAFRADTRQQYRAFFRRAGLTVEQIERFERRMFENRVDQLDLTWSARAQGLKRDDPAIKALDRQQEENLRADLRSMLGAEGYDALQQFKRAESVRRFVNDVATTMALSSRPLDGDQADQLTQLIGEASASYQKGGNAIPWDANWDLVMEKAPTFLSEAQVAALREIGESQVRFVWLLPQFYAEQPPAP